MPDYMLAILGIVIAVAGVFLPVLARRAGTRRRQKRRGRITGCRSRRFGTAACSTPGEIVAGRVEAAIDKDCKVTRDACDDD